MKRASTGETIEPSIDRDPKKLSRIRLRMAHLISWKTLEVDKWIKLVLEEPLG